MTFICELVEHLSCDEFSFLIQGNVAVFLQQFELLVGHITEAILANDQLLLLDVIVVRYVREVVVDGAVDSLVSSH